MRAAVIGGGISGIASAFYLLKKGIKVDLYESENQLGGRAGSDLLQGHWVDFGGKNVGKQYRRFREFAKVCGNPGFEYFGINTSQLINGRIIGISRDGSKLHNLLTISQLCGLPGIIKLYPHIKVILNDPSQGVLNSEHFRNLGERFDHMTLKKFLNGRCIDNVVRPITVRMNGAEPDECYPGNFGSNLALAVDSYEQLTDGMQSLIRKFTTEHGAGLLKILKNHRVSSIQKDMDAIRLDYIHQEKSGVDWYNYVISALPAHDLSHILSQTRPDTASLLSRINYYPVGVSIVKYSSEVFPQNRRAMIFDQNTPLSNAGAYGINDLDIVRYTFSGRTSRMVVSEHSSPKEIVKLGEKIASPYFNLINNKREAFVYRYFKKGLCAYSSKHHLLLKKIDDQISDIAGLGITGDYRRGASIEACFRAANECVDKVIGDRP